MSPSEPLVLELDHARIDAAGEVTCEAATGTISGSRVVLVGDGATAISAAITMRGSVASGSVRLDGLEVASREHVGRVGIAPAGLRLIPRVTVAEYMGMSFLLAGVPKRKVEQAVAVALHEAGVQALAQKRAESLAPPERVAVTIAQALVPGLATVFVDAPLTGLEGPAAKYVLDVLERISDTRRWLATAERGDAEAPDRDLLTAADRIAVLSRREIIWQGTPSGLVAAGKLYVVAARGDVPALRQRLEASGSIVHGTDTRFTAALPDGGHPSDIIEAASEVGAVVIELMPMLPPKASRA